MIERQPFIDGKISPGEAGVHEIINPFDNKVIGKIGYASHSQVGAALDSATAAFAVKVLNAEQRSEILTNASRLLSDLAEECARLITAESGKPITYSRIEVSRGIFTLEASAKAALEIESDLAVETMDAPNSVGREVSYRYFPAGPV